jgi:hypothetical protein
VPFTDLSAARRACVALVWLAGAFGLFVASVRAAPGDLDPAFSHNGLVRTHFGDYSRADAMAIQPDGKIVVGGYSDDKLALARYNGDGTRDDSFSGDGQLTTSFSNPPHNYNSTLATDVALGPGGKIVAGGTRRFGRMWALSRYQVSACPGDADADGVPDARDLCPPRLGHDDGYPTSADHLRSASRPSTPSSGASSQTEVRVPGTPASRSLQETPRT